MVCVAIKDFLLLVSLVAIFSTTSVLCDDTCVIVAPNSIRIGVEETIIVHIEGPPRKVTLYMQDYIVRSTPFFSKTLDMTEDEGQVVNIRIRAEDLPENFFDFTIHRYISLIVECTGIYKKEARLLISDKSGYMFLQTDKPIYTPKQKVHIRFVSVGENFMPSNKDFKLKILNPQHVIIHEKVFLQQSMNESNGLFSYIYTFPESLLLGEWTATVEYGYELKLNSSVTFEVKEYVLPTFSVKLTTPEVILPQEERITGSVVAKYVYGKPVQGKVTFHFRVKGEVGEPRHIGSTDMKELKNGMAEYSLSMDNFKQDTRGSWPPLLLGHHLVVEADVLDLSSGKRERAVDDSAVFATTPYSVSFKHSPKDFKPGTPVLVVAEISNVNGEPVRGVRATIFVLNDREIKVDVDDESSKSDQDGKVYYLVETEERDRRLKVKVRTDDPNYEHNHQAERRIELLPYSSPSNAFLSLKWTKNTDLPQVGQYYTVTVVSRPRTIGPIYYAVISRGYAFVSGKLPGTNLDEQRFSFVVTENMSPSLRIFVYAVVNQHLVGDSIFLDVEQKCKRAADIHIEKGFSAEEPGSAGVIRVRGMSGTKVGLLAVDEAVYILRKKHLLTRSLLFKAIRTHDFGCGPGGGLTTDDVLASAGVVIISKALKDNIIRADYGCESRIRRKRHALTEQRNAYTEPFLKECCGFGQVRNHRKTCDERAQTIREFHPTVDGQRCAEAFLNCCRSSVSARLGSIHAMPSSERGRTLSGEDTDVLSPEDYDEEELNDVTIRKDFRETWIFSEEIIDHDQVAEFRAKLPHSITTWSIQAVSVAPDGGICVANPVELRSFRNVFLHVHLPYKVVRNEQVEVLVTIYNYGDLQLQGRVYMYGVEGLCSGAAPGEKMEIKKVTVPSNSATSVTFPVVPLQSKEYPIKVSIISNRGKDAVEKILNAVPEGMPVERSISVSLDPNNQQQRQKRSITGNFYRDSIDPGRRVQYIAIHTRVPPEAVPETESCVVSVIGDKMGPTVQTTINDLSNLIRMPSGCGEQNMMSMSPTLYTVDYLSGTERLNETTAEKAFNFIKKGYERELSFRKPDGSYSAFMHRPASTWLTAFVMRVFCKARNFIEIDRTVIQSGVQWLFSQQQEDGSFRENKPVLHKEMLGGVKGSVPMTAFVLITLEECSRVVESTNEKYRSISYLEEQLEVISDPYVAAIVSYALSLTNSSWKYEANDILKGKLLYDPELNTRSTGREANPLTVEGTSYALLAQLQLNDVVYSAPLVYWLNMQRSSSGAFQSTQDTVMALQALAQYAKRIRDPLLDLTCNFTVSSSRRQKKSIRINPENAALLQQVPIDKLGGNINVYTSGVGSGVLSVNLKYNVIVPPDVLCKFNITVKADIYVPQLDFQAESDFFSDQLKDELEDKTVTEDSNLVLQPSTSRSKITYKVDVCARYLEDTDSNMAVIEVGTFSGYVPVESDLKQYLQNQSSLLDKYEVTDRNVILYLEKVPPRIDTCFSFRIVQEHRVNNIQASVVKVYDYYNPDHRCSIFYGPGANSPLLKLHCEGKICQCAEALCPSNSRFNQIRRKPTNTGRRELYRLVCEKFDFVWKVQVVSTTVTNGFRNLTLRALKVIKEGAEGRASVEKEAKHFLSREFCRETDLHPDQKYIIFGKDGAVTEHEGRTEVKYEIDSNAMVLIYEERPSSPERINYMRHLIWIETVFPKRGCRKVT